LLSSRRDAQGRIMIYGPKLKATQLKLSGL
jgi:hypothetical protein